MNKRQKRCLEVVKIQDISPNMRRFTFAGEGYEDFPDDVAGSYIKLFFNPDTELQRVRTYTIRQQTATSMDVDFVLHGETGIASRWAYRAAVGDQIFIGGPGKGQMIYPEAEYFILAGDMTALPAISVNLEQLPSDAKGHALIQIESEQDKQDLIAPPQMTIEWIVAPLGNSEALLASLRQMRWPTGDVAVWAACEFEGMRALRHFFKQEKQVPKSHLYVSSYWKNGIAEDEHKQLKKADNEANAA